MIYVFCGPDDFSISEAVKKLLAAALPADTADLNTTRLGAAEDYVRLHPDMVSAHEAAFVDASIRYHVAEGLSIAGTLRNVGRYYADDANLARIKASTIFGAEAEYGRATPFGRMSVFVAGENLSDEDYVSSVFINGVRGEFYEPGLPASVSAGVTISLR